MEWKLKNKIGICLFLSMKLYALNVEPLTFGKIIDYGDKGYKEYTLTNDTSQKQIYKVKFLGLDKEKFEVKSYPRVINLESGERKKLKVLVQQKQEILEGEYFFEMLLVPVKVPTLKKSNGIYGELGTVIGIDFACYVGDLGNIEKDVSIKNLEVNDEIRFLLENKLNRSLKIGVKTINNNKTVEEFNFIKRIPKNFKKEIKLKMEDNNINKIEIYDIESEKILYKKSLEKGGEDVIY